MLFEQDTLYYAEQIKNGQITPIEMVERTIDAIHSLNRRLNAVSYLYTAEAREQAQRMTDHLENMTKNQRQALPPFYGIPLLVKDLGQNVEGMINASGSALLKDNACQHTDTVFKQAQAAGFILLGRTNVPEFGLKTVSDSRYFGVVKHPMDLTRNPGGSSGGAAAAVKSGMVPIATGSDAGGSIRVPASDTGLIGLKPSRGRIAQGPGFYRPMNGLATNLVLTRSVRDTFAYLKVAQKAQFADGNYLPEITASSLEPLMQPLKIAYLSASFYGKANSADANNALKQTIEQLKRLGHHVEEVTLAIDGNDLMRYYYHSLMVETSAMLEGIAPNGTAIDFDKVDPLTWLAYKLGPTIPASIYAQMTKFVDRLREMMEHLHDTYDVLLMPSAADIAMKNDDIPLPKTFIHTIERIEEFPADKQWEIAKEAFDHIYARTPYSQLFNLTGQPAISLPLYQNVQGMPLGSQFSARVGNEYLLLQLAQQLEEKHMLKTAICHLPKPQSSH